MTTEVPVQAQLLGKPAFYNNGSWYTLSDSKSTALLCYLVYQGDWVSREDIIYLIWPDIEEKKARNNLRQMLSASRKLPYLTNLETKDNSLRWLVQSDVQELTEAVNNKQWGKVVSLYQGLLLEGVIADNIPEFQSWLELERASLFTTYRDAVFHSAAQLETQARHAQAAEILYDLHKLEPFDEAIFRHYLELLTLNDQHLKAKEVYERFEKNLQTELGNAPEQSTQQLIARISSGETFTTPSTKILTQGTAMSSSKTQLNIPMSATNFLGRSREISEVIGTLGDPACRLLTIIAAGGMGKTRLALEVGERLTADFADGVCFIPFEAISSADFMVSAMADALSFSFFGKQEPKEQLLSYLKNKHMLLIMDNLEHLLMDMNLIIRLLEQAPKLSILATSREPLQLHAEWLYDLSGMQLPPMSKETQADDAYDSDAVKLLLQSARKTKAGFTINDQNREAVIGLCHLVEGMPLALELAASWLRVLSVAEVTSAIKNKLNPLQSAWQDVPTRHQSMRAVFDSSWQRFSNAEKIALRKLSVFHSGFTKEAALEVAEVGLPLILLLSNKSFLRRSKMGRFSQHPLLWQYAHEEAEHHQDGFEKTAEKHAKFFATFLQEREAKHESLEAGHLRKEIALELANIQAAWGWAVAHKREDLLDQALWSLFEFYKGESRIQEGKDLFSYAEKHIDQHSLIRARLLHKLGIFHNLHGTYAEGEKLLKQSQAIAKQHGSKEDIAHALFVLNNTYGSNGRKSKAYREALCRQYLTLFREVGNRYFEARSLWHLALFTTDSDESEALHQEAIRLFRETKGFFGLSAALMTYAKDVLERYGDYEEANALIDEAFDIEQRRGISYRLTWLYSSRGFILMAQGKYHEAQSQLEEAILLRRKFEIEGFDGPALHSLGRLSRLQQNFERADIYLQEALEQSKKT